MIIKHGNSLLLSKTLENRNRISMNIDLLIFSVLDNLFIITNSSPVHGKNF